MNQRCPICGLWELNDGSEDTLYTCECEECDHKFVVRTSSAPCEPYELVKVCDDCGFEATE